MAQQGFAGKLKIRPELYEVTLDFDSIDIERGTALLQATEKATRIGRAFAVGKVLLANRVLCDRSPTTARISPTTRTAHEWGAPDYRQRWCAPTCGPLTALNTRNSVLH